MFVCSLDFNFFYDWMISRSRYFGFRRKHLILFGSKNSQRGQTTDFAEIWSPTWEGQTSSGWVNSTADTFIFWLPWPGWPCTSQPGDTFIVVSISLGSGGSGWPNAVKFEECSISVRELSYNRIINKCIYISFYMYLIAWMLSVISGFMLSLYGNHQAEKDFCKDGIKPVVTNKHPCN